MRPSVALCASARVGGEVASAAGQAIAYAALAVAMVIGALVSGFMWALLLWAREFDFPASRVRNAVLSTVTVAIWLAGAAASLTFRPGSPGEWVLGAAEVGCIASGLTMAALFAEAAARRCAESIGSAFRRNAERCAGGGAP